jgi:hypothetical protein
LRFAWITRGEIGSIQPQRLAILPNQAGISKQKVANAKNHFGNFFGLQDSATNQKQLTLLPLSVKMQKILLRKNVEIHFAFSSRGAGLPPSCSGFPQLISTF